ncbi:MAG: KR domain-containing protein [Gammaproteobacteria bacterium]|nr:KR domain-containing protein [Gammaproteobacteria bacterium]
MVSSNTQSVFADEPSAYEKSPALGLIKTISQEIPWLSAHHLDMPLDKPESNAEFVRQELQAFSTEREVAYRREQRWVPRLQKADLAAEPVRPAPFKRGGIYLFSGGLGGIGMEIAKYLLQTWQAKVLLIGRTPLPGQASGASSPQTELQKHKLRNYRSLQQLEGDILYEIADVCDPLWLRQVAEKAEKHWGGQTGRRYPPCRHL